MEQRPLSLSLTIWSLTFPVLNDELRVLTNTIVRLSENAGKRKEYHLTVYKNRYVWGHVRFDDCT